MPPVMFSVVTKYHKRRHSLFLYNPEIFYAFTQDILRSQKKELVGKLPINSKYRSANFICRCFVGESLDTYKAKIRN
ncbi:hypothetical protein EQJ27_15390 (plasmid) [Lactiplantibacillus plantarum]|nr:hypothetical protein EQJ27_15290 [Lactiplantibacillus plantarum]QAR39289.1 hypothetical protein EQJ27_15390 [Lactiplantibacillus plantarum]RWZ05211.1 hypothetical protein EQG51_15320 [Lactiplantibacillus plantarum]